MRKALALVGALTLLLTGCSAINDGYITEKHFSPAHSSVITVCRMIGKVTSCTPQVQYYPDSWWFDIQEGEDTGWVYVGSQTFDQYQVGDYYETVDN